ncbi:hypothetical protein D3C78_1408580 [compost metagenome]
MEDAAGLDAHRAGQVAYRGALVTFAAKQVGRRLQQFSPGALRVGQLPVGHHFQQYVARFLLVHAVDLPSSLSRAKRRKPYLPANVCRPG